MFAPNFIDALDNAKAKIKLPAGEAASEWHREGDEIVCTFTVPEGAKAEFCVASGWQTSDGFTWLPLKAGVFTYRLIKENKFDSKRIYSER